MTIENEKETIIDSEENNEELEETNTESENEEVEEESKEEPKDKVERPTETLEAKKARLKRQLERLDKKLGIKEEKPDVKEPEFTLSYKDQIALSKADVHEDDIDEVIEYAKFKKVSVSEALKSSVVKATLAEKSEFRRANNAANDRGSKRTVAKASPEKLITDLKDGKVPEPGSNEAEELFWARRGGRR